MSTKNGHKSVDILAKAMRQVFKEAVEEGNLPLKREVKKLDKKVGTLREDLEQGLKTTNKNVQVQLAQHRKDTTKDFREVLAESKS